MSEELAAPIFRVGFTATLIMKAALSSKMFNPGDGGSVFLQYVQPPQMGQHVL
jgi:hypothetical protein